MTDDVLLLTEDRLAALADQWVSRLSPQRRLLLGIAGIPASGKSTLAAKFMDLINARSPGAAVLAPMDGFHFRNDELERMGLRHRKGGPQTFDVQRYMDLLAQARDPRRALVFPVYDRDLHEPVLRDVPAQRIGANVKLVITEGNYLLLDEDPWRGLADVLDECWLLKTDRQRARQWIIARHVRGGRSPQDAERHFDQSDRLNVDMVLNRMRRPHRIVTWRDLP